jgi:Rps23 Pro-64 3,4-dihydroxylase Tpa1-like proline 4-hydroxylase
VIGKAGGVDVKRSPAHLSIAGRDTDEGAAMFPFPIAQQHSGNIDQFVEQFRGAPLVRHVTIDGFLDEEFAHRLIAEFPDLTDMPKSRDYMFSDKRELSTLDRHGESSRQLHSGLASQPFVDFLSRLVDHEVFLDPEYIGGGFHAGAPGSFLDLHTDFNLHPVHDDWFRELNVLIYLNPDWEPSWGGELLLTDDPAREGLAIAPVFNRAVIMESTATSFHGYRRLTFPEGTARRSIAAYAYSLTDVGAVTRRTTNWVPENAGFLKSMAAKNWNRIVLTKNKFLGSGTVKNRR